jgi:pimeloyl-ACP methyl ester carboxylesterase
MILSFLPQGLLFDRFFRSFTFEENLREPTVRATNACVGHQMYLGLRHFRAWQNWQSQNIEPHVFPDTELRGMHVPTLLLIGQQEGLYDPVAAVARARKLVPNLVGELIPQAKHAMFIEQRGIVDTRISEFLTGIPKDLPVNHSVGDGVASGRPATDPVSV